MGTSDAEDEEEEEKMKKTKKMEEEKTKTMKEELSSSRVYGQTQAQETSSWNVSNIAPRYYSY